MAVSTLTALPNSERPLGLVGSGGECIIQFLTCRINYADVAAAGTFKIFDLPAKSAVLFAWFIVETTFTGSSMTMEVESSDTNATYISATDGTVTTMVAGNVHKSVSAAGASALNDEQGHADEYDLAARTINFVSGGGTAWTAGIGTLIIGFVTLP